jgi:hypothetical protein
LLISGDLLIPTTRSRRISDVMAVARDYTLILVEAIWLLLSAVAKFADLLDGKS